MLDKVSNSYLSKLRFTKELENGIVAKYFRNIRIVLLVLLSVIIAGTYSFINLPRELNPNIDIAIVIVNTALPGASPEEVEILVTRPLEAEIAGVEGVNTYSSTSSNSISSIVIEFADGVRRETAVSRIQSAVDSISNLPDDATTPNVADLDFADVPIWIFSLTAGNDIPGLDRFSQRLKEEIEAHPGIDRVAVSGLQRREIQIIVSPETISELGITFFQIQNIIRAALSSYPLGEVKTDTITYSLAIDQAINSIQDIRDQNILIQGQIYKLSDIADISETTAPSQGRSFLSSPTEEINQAITFNVYKKASAEINQTTLDVQSIVAEEVNSLDHFQYETIIDFADEIGVQFNDLIRSFLLTVMLVFAVMLIFLGIKEAFLATISIPLTIFIGLTVMLGTGITLNFISIFSLLIALGMLVDNAVVVVSAVNSYYRTGKFTAYQTGLLVFKDFFVPLISTNMTTVWAFLPLILATGIIGKFIEPIPIIVSTIIISSSLVGFFLVLPISLFVLSPKLPKRVRYLLTGVGLVSFLIIVYSLIPNSTFNLIIAGLSTFGLFILPKVLSKLKQNLIGRNPINISSKLNNGFVNLSLIGDWYKEKLLKVLDSKVARIKILIAVIVFALFTYTLPILGFVPNIFFPAGDADILYISVEQPLGTSIEISESAAINILNEIKEKPYLNNIVAELGASAPNTSMARGDHLILFTLNLKPENDRDKSSMQIASELREEYSNYQNGTVLVIEQSGGPPAGADIEIKISGPELEQLDIYARNIQSYLSEQSNVTNINQSVKTGPGKFVFEPEILKLTEYGITQQDIAFQMRIFASGSKIDEIEIDQRTYDITFRVSKAYLSPEDLFQLNIPTQQGLIPLQELGTFTLKPNPSIINRENGRRTITVTASVIDGGNPTLIGQNLENFANTELNLASGYTWKTGGVNEENARSVQSIIMAMGLSAILILTTLVIQLGSFRKAFIVMIIIPLALSGVFLFFAILQIPLSFPALIGMLALFGIVVNNSILVVEKINQNLASKIPYKEAIADAVSSRLEPILLTTMTTIIGLIPITLSDPLWRGLGGAVICGLTVSGTIVLIIIPTVYYMLMSKTEEKSHAHFIRN